MQLPKSEFDSKRIEQVLITENKFITELFSILSLPTRHNDDENEEEDEAEPQDVTKPPKPKDTTRAKSITELQGRLEAVTKTKRLNYKDKITKKKLKNRIKKKSKQDERNANAKLARAEKMIKSNPDSEETLKTTANVVNRKPAKPVFNSEGKMVFSKFDFSNIGGKSNKKHEKDPKKLLENLEKQKEKFDELVEQGELSKAVEIKEKSAWKNALAKAGGEKVRDDANLLKKTVKKNEQKKRSSKKKWEDRNQKVANAKDERQKKRTENIDKRKSDKKNTKLKKAVKRGRVIPGF